MPKPNVRTTALKRRTDKVPSGVGEQTVETDAIARRAYERFEERGREHGHDIEDWLDAEREREHHDSGPPLRLEQHAHGVADVFQHEVSEPEPSV